MLSAAGGCELSTTTCVNTSWKKFKELLPVLSSQHLSFKTHGCMYTLVCGLQCSIPVRQSQTSTICSRMTGQWSDRSAMSSHKTCHHQVQWATCGAWYWGSGHRSERERLPWYGHVECSKGAVKTAFNILVDRKRGPGRPKMTLSSWQRYCREWKLTAIDPHDRHTWRSDVRSAMPAARQLPGRGPTDVDVAPIPAH